MSRQKIFTANLKNKPPELMRAIRTWHSGEKYRNVVIRGCENSGRITGRGFEIYYRFDEMLNGTRARILIAGKPFHVPWRLVEAAIEKLSREW